MYYVLYISTLLVINDETSTLLAKAATLPHYSISSYNVKGSFLNSSVPEDIYVYVRVDSELFVMFIDRYPQLKRILKNNGTLTFRFKRYLYGLQESLLAQNKLLHQKLQKTNFIRPLCVYETSRRRDNLSHSCSVSPLLDTEQTKPECATRE